MYGEIKQTGIETRNRVYHFLVDFIAENGYSPSVREICEGTDLKSTSSVYNHLLTLERMGKIHIEPKKTRAISIVDYDFVKVG